MPEVKFIEVESKPDCGFNLLTMLGKQPTKGTVGLEIEIEGTKLPHEDETPDPWEYHPDGSLRGKDNGEYVLASPLDFDAIPGALDTLWKKFKAKKSTFDDSNRTSVHVHLNFQSFFLDRFTTFLALYFAVEEPLVAWCGPEREGNLFCLRAVDAPAIITHLRKFIKSDGEVPLHDVLHYSALNPNALHKYGSIEIRTMGGCSDPKRILQWLNILRRLYDFSKEFKTPTDVIGLYSGVGPMSFFNSILGQQSTVVREGINWTDDDIIRAMFRGVRFAQQLCYCRDWSTYKTVDIKPDPFGRDNKKVASKVMAAASGILPGTFGANSPYYASVESANAALAHASQMVQQQPTEPSPYDWAHDLDI